MLIEIVDRWDDRRRMMFCLSTAYTDLLLVTITTTVSQANAIDSANSIGSNDVT